MTGCICCKEEIFLYKLIRNLFQFMKKKSVVVIGGGNGSSITIRALKDNKDVFDISAIISMTDSGGSSGRLRTELDALPPGDILRAVLSMSEFYDYENVLRPLAEYSGDFILGVRALEQAVGAVGKVFPSTTDRADLAAELENGEKIFTEAAIDRPKYDRSIKIKKLSLTAPAKIYPEAAKAIEEADYVIFSAGSLYCSVIATVLPEGFSEVFVNSKAKLVFVAGNKYELDGETGPTRMCDCLWTLEEYLPKKIDKMIFNAHELTGKQKEYYAKKRWGVLDYNPELVRKTTVVGENFERETAGLDPEVLGKIFLRELV